MSRFEFMVLASGLTMASVLAASAGAVRLARARHARLLALAAVGVYLISLLWHPPVGVASNVFTLAGGMAGAALIARGLAEPRAVIVFLVVAALVDLLSFSDGLTRAIIDAYRTGESRLLLHLTLTAPIGGSWVPMVGVGDLVMGGAAGAALVRAGRGFWRVTGVLWAGLLLALVVGLWRGGAAAVPFMAATVALDTWWQRPRTKS